MIKTFYIGGKNNPQISLYFLSKMASQFLASPASFAGAERLFGKAGKMHDDHKKSTEEVTLESQLLISMNYPDA
jgi:hypothetical protein